MAGPGSERRKQRDRLERVDDRVRLAARRVDVLEPRLHPVGAEDRVELGVLGEALTEVERGLAAIDLATANVYAGEIGLAVSSGIFEVMGSRSATKANGYDRFWRNVRTHTLHNPAEYKKRTIGTWLLTGEFPVGGLYR